jgi:hypothetical protein
MPFQSEAQRRYLFANEPEIAHRWAKEYPGQKHLPMHKKKQKKKGKKTSKRYSKQ